MFATDNQYLLMVEPPAEIRHHLWKSAADPPAAKRQTEFVMYVRDFMPWGNFKS